VPMRLAPDEGSSRTTNNCAYARRGSPVGPRLARRGLFAWAGALATLAAAPPLLAATWRRAPVVSLHAAEPFLDPTGTEMPYFPRIATDWAIGLNDEALARLGHLVQPGEGG
jgi:hypothetical protein